MSTICPQITKLVYLAVAPLGLTYAESGVNISAGDEFIRRIKKSVRSTFTKDVLSDLGSFGALYDARFSRYKHPVLVSSVDGVGTKLLVAHLMKRHDTVGQDLVNHCVNDILACGARPLFFLDYFAAGRLNPVDAASVLQGFVKACKENKCALVGGETAEMPGLYGENEYDLSGTVVGVVEKRKIVTGAKIRKGDLLIGLHSTGLHTNGYSLARTVLFRKYGVNDYVYDLGDTVGNYLLRVHKSYLNSVWSLMESIQLNGIAHITGGGIVGNTSRILPKGLSIDINWKSWQRPTIFQLIQETGGVPEEDMQRTFNLGVGLIVIVSKRNSEKAQTHLSKMGEHPFIMGEVN